MDTGEWTVVRLMIDSEQCPIAVPCYAPLTCVPQSQTLFGEFMNKWDRWCCPSFTCKSCSEVGQSKGESAASIQLSCQLGPDRLDEGDWQLESACEVISFRGALSAAGTVDFLLEDVFGPMPSTSDAPQRQHRRRKAEGAGA